MDGDYILLEIKDRLGIITINRPEKYNALNSGLLKRLESVLLEISLDEDIGAIIIHGAGEEAFAAGADIEELDRINSVNGAEFCQYGQSVMNVIANLSKPVIAAVNGLALGGGCELALACSIRIASEKAKFGLPEVKLGIMPGYGGTQRLPRLIGKGKGLELLLTGDTIDAQEAYRIGLVSQVVPHGELILRCISLTKKITSNAPLAIKRVLEAVNQGYEMPMGESLMFESYLVGSLMGSEDKQEGLAAFKEKRSPDFKGK